MQEGRRAAAGLSTEAELCCDMVSFADRCRLDRLGVIRKLARRIGEFLGRRVNKSEKFTAILGGHAIRRSTLKNSEISFIPT
jgi:hypothetical protein